MAVNKLDPKVIFASEAPAQDTPAVFTNRTVGWGETRKNGGRPTIKQMNAEQQSTDLKILWLNENAVTPYDSAIDYPVDAVTIKDGVFKIFDGSVWNLFLDKTDIGLGDVDNTSDLNKPVSTATQTALDLKANKTYVDTSIPHNNLIDRNSSGAHETAAIVNNSGETQQQINDRVGATWYAKSSGYDLNDRVILGNGDIVKSTVANNIVDPNVDMTGWLVVSSSKKLTIYAEDYGVVNSSTVDSFDKLSYVLNRFIDAEIILPPKFALSQSVVYSNQTISGVATSHCVGYMLNGFVGESAFTPRDKMDVGASRPQEAIIKNITFVDSSASNDGRGTTSTKNGVDITGTFGVKCLNLKGVRVNRVVFADVGPDGQEQWTKRPEIRGLEGSNVNYLWQFMPTTESRFPYGDVVCSDIFPKGSIKYGAWAEDCDGFTFSGDTLFSSGQLKVSGNYITINTAHAFDGKAALTESSEISAECIIVASRKSGIRNWNVQITDVFATFAGRLADTTIGNPPQTNKGAWAVRLNNCDEFRLSGVINDPSQGGVFLNNCVNGTVDVTTRRVNTQDTGSGVLPAGTYDAVFLQSCSSVNVNLTDNSPSKRHAVYVDDNSEGNVIRVTSPVRGLGGIGSQVRIPNNNKNFVEVLTKDLSDKLVVFASQTPSIIPVVESSGTQSPSIGYGREGINIQFNNSVSTNVLDIPSITSGQKAFIYIQDNGATKFVDQSLATGGKFRFKDGATKLGRDFGCWVWREPNSGFLREV